LSSFEDKTIEKEGEYNLTTMLSFHLESAQRAYFCRAILVKENYCLLYWKFLQHNGTKSINLIETSGSSNHYYSVLYLTFL
jgi:hypothetical protein